MALREFCAKINIYLDGLEAAPGNDSARSSTGCPVPEEFLAGSSRIIDDTLGRLGVDVKSDRGGVRNGGAKETISGNEGGNGEEAAVRALVDFREAVRGAARSNASWGEIFKLCDDVRDVTAPDLGWKITDGKGRSTFHRK